MSTEVELKYLVAAMDNEQDFVADAITAMFNAQNSKVGINEKHLGNDYFDSDNLALRAMDIGLRIRCQNGQFEQTIKTAGKVLGCLHQRPEYNVDIANNTIDLSLFPDHIWPDNTNIAKLQKSLRVLFSTNFLRKTWLVQLDASVIELALDRGTISTEHSQSKLAINEIEIELVSGDEKALFSLAEQLNNIIEMQPGKLSKAARGYTLFHDNK